MKMISLDQFQSTNNMQKTSHVMPQIDQKPPSTNGIYISSRQ